MADQLCLNCSILIYTVTFQFVYITLNLTDIFEVLTRDLIVVAKLTNRVCYSTFASIPSLYSNSLNLLSFLLCVYLLFEVICKFLSKY